MGPAIDRSSPPRGFTLIELLVGVAVLAVLTASATLLGLRGASRDDSDAALFRRHYETLRHLAITGGQTRGLRVEGTRIGLARRGFDGWAPTEPPIRLAGRAVLSTVRTAGPGADPEAPQIIALASGQTTGFSVTLGRVRCETDGWAELTCND